MSTEIARYASLHLTIERELPSSVNLAATLAEFGLADQPQETLWVCAYDSVQRVRTIVEVAKGGYHDVDVPIPAVLSAVLVTGCNRFEIAHNHPTGDVSPTFADVDMTEKVMVAANVCGMYFEDSVIVGPTGVSYSFANAGILTPSRDIATMARTHRKAKV